MAEMPYAREYTPELSQDYLAGELADIEDLYRQEEGRATAEAGARGLLGQQQGDAMVGQVRAAKVRGLSDAIRNFNLNVAGLRREERLTSENRDFTREGWQFESSEAEKNRAFQEKLAQMGYAYGDASARRDYLYGQRGAIQGAGIQIGTQLLGKGLASLSDRRLKTNVEDTGERVGPLVVYTFDYLRDDYPDLDMPSGRQRGFMADEVERYYPQAVSVNPHGYKVVDYAVLGGQP